MRTDQRALRRRGDHGGRRVGHVARHANSGDGRRTRRIRLDHLAETHRVGHRVQAERGEQFAPGAEAQPHGERVERNDGAVGQGDTAEGVVGGLDGRDRRGDDVDTARAESRAVVLGRLRAVGQVDHAIRPLPPQRGVMQAHRRRAEDADAPVPDLPAVAIRALDDVPTPPLGQAGHVGQVVGESGGDDQPTGGERRAVVGGGGEVAGVAAEIGDGRVDDADVVPVQIRPPVLQVVERGGVVAAEHAVHVRGGCVARGAVVEDDDTATGTAQHECCAQARGAAADHQNVGVGPGVGGGVGVCGHGCHCEAVSRI